MHDTIMLGAVLDRRSKVEKELDTRHDNGGYTTNDLARGTLQEYVMNPIINAICFCLENASNVVDDTRRVSV